MKRLSLFTRSYKLLLATMALTACFASPRADAQSISSYTFSQALGTYTEIAGGDLISGADDDDSEYGVNIGFTFKYNGTEYDQVAIWTNGYLVFGSTEQMGGNPSFQQALGTEADIISPLSGDLVASSTGEIRTQVTGTSPNRVFTVQWKNYDYWHNSYTANPDYNFQIKLYETSNNIEIIYGSMTMTPDQDHSAGSHPAWNHVGIRSSSVIRSRSIKNGINTWATSTESSSVVANDLLTSIYPASGLTYTWTPPPPNEGAITGFTSPVTPFAAGTQNITLNLRNTGSNTLTSATINWTVNGVAQTPYSWTGSLGTDAASAITLSSFDFVSGNTYVISATISSVNGTTDADNTNNTASAAFTPALSGTYTIGGTNPNFPTLATAAQTLSSGGVMGAVTFNVRAGTYNEQFAIVNYPNASTLRPVIFQSESGNPSSVVVNYAASSTTDNYVVRLDNADNISIMNMTLANIGVNYGAVVDIRNGSDNVILSGNILNGRNAASSAFDDAVVYMPQSMTNANNNLTISGNTIRFGSLGIYSWGHSSSTGQLATGLRIENNTIRDAFAGPILIDYNNGAVVENNNLVGSANGRLTGYAVRIRFSDGDIRVEKNRIHSFIAGRGIVIEGTFNGTGRPRISNNFIEMGAGTVNDADGINILRSNVDVYNNTIKITSTNSGSDAIDIGTFTSVDIRNNILIAAVGHALKATDDFGTADFNNLWTSGSILVSYNGTDYPTLSAWQLTGKGTNSVSVMPVFVSVTDFHLASVQPQLFGAAGLSTTDIDNETRRMNYMGADEVIPVISITAQPIATTTGCVGITNTLSVGSTSTFNSQRSYQWQKNGNPIFDNDRISGANSPTLTIVNSQVADQGVYALRITDNGGSTPVLSTASTIVVNAPIQIIRQPLSQVTCAGAEAALSVVANGTINGIQWQKEDPNAVGGFRNIPGATTEQIFLNNVNNTTSGRYRAMLFGTCGTDIVYTNTATVFVGTPTWIVYQLENNLTGLGGTAKFSVEAEILETPTEGASYQWYRNGVALTDDARISGSRSSVLTISDIRSTDTSATYYAQVTGVCGTAQSNTARIYIAGITLATAPQSVEVCTGGNATMNVVATPSIGGSTMTYQWMKDGVAMQDGGRVSGSRTSTLTITGVTSSDVSSNYTVMVTSQPGNVRLTSPAAGVSLKAATAISQQPQSREVCQGSPLDLGVTATGSGLSYEWRLNGQAVSGATSSTYAPSATPEMSGEYTVIVRGECGEVSSETVTVTVNQQTAITQQPVATLSQNQFNTLTLSVAATGTGTLSYQWYKDGNAISGATTATYTKANSSPTDAGRYYVEVTGTCGMVRSSETTVEITTSVADIPQAGYSVEATQPNPVMEEGRISFTLGRSEMTTVTITDMFGREVAVLASMFMTEGHHTVSFSASGLNLASGSYIYTVATPTFRATRQLLIVR